MMTQILNPDNYAITMHAAFSMLVGTAVAVLGIYVLARERGSRIGVVFWLFTVCISVWLVSFGMDYASLQPGPSLCWIRLSQMGVTFIPAAVLALTAALIQRARQYRTLVRISMIVSSLFCIGVAATSLHIKGLYHYFWGYFPVYGPLGIIFLAYFFGIMIFILYLYRTEYRRTIKSRHRKRMKGMLLAFSIGYAASLDFFPAFGIPLYPFGYVTITIFLVITASVILRYRLVDITPELAAGKILETMQGAVVVVDLEGRIRVMNLAAYYILGYREPELIGMNISSVIELPDFLRDHNRLSDGNIHAHEMIWIDRNGRQTDVSVSAALVTDSRGLPAGVAYVAHDITERKRAEDQLKKYSEGLKQSNEEIISFTHIVSHDLRAPLVSIKGFSTELAKTIEEITLLIDPCLSHLEEGKRKRLQVLVRQDVREALEFISSSVHRMDGLISAVLTLSRLGRRELKPEPVDMEELAYAILESLAHQIEQRKVNVAVAELPEIVADRISMEQIMGNLLDNALKYLEPGRNGVIAITAEKGADETVFHIRDNGRGIAKEDMHKVFEIFRRAGRQDVPGEGMGLAYVKTLARRHGGGIWCESESGVGSTFSFSVPAVKEAVQ